MQRLIYPKSRKGDQVDDYHGTRVADPYRWLEDTNSDETKAWIEAQNRLTFGFLEKIPVREQIRARLTELWDYPKAGSPFQHGGRYFQFRNTGLQNQDVLFVREGPALVRELKQRGKRVFLDLKWHDIPATVKRAFLTASAYGPEFVTVHCDAGQSWLKEVAENNPGNTKILAVTLLTSLNSQ